MFPLAFKIFFFFTPNLIYNVIPNDIKGAEITQFNFNFENDFMFETDEYYNHNTKLDFIFKGKHFLYSLDLKQSLYTPAEHELTYVPKNDMPYTSINELELGIHSRFLNKYMLSLKTGIGYTGRRTGGKEVMANLHAVLPSKPEFNAWDTQKAKIVGKISATFFQKSKINDFMDIVSSENLTVSNFRSVASAGVQARIGFNLPENFGTWSAETNKLNYSKKTSKCSLYALFGGHYNYIFNDFTLRNLEMKHNLYQINYGFGFNYQNFDISLLHTQETQRFTTQNSDKFGYSNIMISYSF